MSASNVVQISLDAGSTWTYPRRARKGQEMTWWRQSRDASGMTIVGRLELIDGNCLTNMANCGYDEDGCALYLAISHHRKRIRSILRRLKRCVKCHGTGKVPGLEERGGPWMEYQVLIEEECMACGGTGRIRREG